MRRPWRPGTIPVIEPLFIAVWLVELGRIVVPGIGLERLSTVLFAALFAVALSGLRRQMVPLAGGLGLAAAAIAAYSGDWMALLDGLQRARVFVAFFGTLIVLSATAERRPETTRARALFAALPADQRAGATLLGAHVMGSVLLVGAHAILAPIYGSKAPPAARYAGAIMSQRGMGLAGMWSPFWVAMAIAYQHLPNVALWSIMGLGAALAVPGLLIGQAMAGRVHWRGTVALLPVVPSVTIAAATGVSLAMFTRLQPLEALVIGIPVLCFLALLPSGTRGLVETARTAIGRTRSVLGELVLVSCAFMLGRVLVGVLADVQAAEWLGRNMPPAPAVIATVIAATTLLALIGMHQIVTITVLLVLLVEVPSGVADLVLMEAALIAWSFSAMVGLSAVSTAAAASLFEVRIDRLAWGPNVGFALVFGIFATVVLSVLNRFIA